MNPSKSSLINNGIKFPQSSQFSGDDTLSLMSETSDDSFVDINTNIKCHVEKGVNTEDTLRLIPFEVDHWASRCIRLADEFQTSRSFEDAQSNISELDESLKEYLKLRESDGALRTDILLYVILANIIDGLETNGHIFMSEVPSVSKIVTKCLLTSGQLGRYGFQSFKQSMKAIRFLQNYYQKREIEPDKLPVILWQSVKKITLQGTTPYPTLYPGELHFHLETCPENESCKTLRLDFGALALASTPIILKHCTSTLEIIEAFKSLSSQNLDFGCDHIQPKLEFRNRSLFDQSQLHSARGKHWDIALQQMVVCDIDFNHSPENKLLISDILQSQPQYSKAFQQFQRNYGGSIVIRFKSRYFNGERKYSDTARFYTLGTKQYLDKHSQILLVVVNEGENKNSDHLAENGNEWLVADLNGRKVQEAEKIQDIQSFKWDLKFGSCKSGCWTYPEVHFLENLVLLPLLEDCSISFEDHVCPTDTNLSGKCSDCKLTDGINSSSSISVDQVFASGSVQINVRLDLKANGLLNILSESGIACNDVAINFAKFALFKFVLSIPLDLRGLVVKLQQESKLKNAECGLFGEEDFKEILKLWDLHKDYYYSVWYPS